MMQNGRINLAIARLVQYITAQGMLISMLLAEFRSMDSNVVQVVKEAYHKARKFASLDVCPTPSDRLARSAFEL